MKKHLILSIISLLFLSSCNNWLDILPNNEQVTEMYWKSKEDVEQVVAAGYYYMRQTTPYLIDWGELRGSSIMTPYTEKDKLQNFQLLATSSLCEWGIFYQVINMANSVLDYAPEVQGIDNTYTIEAMRSHQTEAYFMRALMYFYLVRNFKEVPLVLSAYVDDSTPYNIPKSTEEEIIAQIKQDITTALESRAAKEFFENTSWAYASKGRATKWALYALMAEVCLWSEDYDDCIIYANELIDATSAYRPAFVMDGSIWFEMFEIGNSNESIFELNWESGTYSQTAYSPSNYFSKYETTTYQFSRATTNRLQEQQTQANLYGSGTYRGLNATYNNTEGETRAIPWKYIGLQNGSDRTTTDANLIIYRMADVMLMKAEALIWKGQNYWEEALNIINQIRARANVPEYELNLSALTEESLLQILLEERDLELAAEFKRWYDLVRFGKSQNYKYKTQFINMIIENNETASSSWLRSVLQNNNAWCLPINEKELTSNDALVQNPYYESTN
ncbi:MAG: RagB/SusD family nutrient uptake outer membrane protein [Rikenellaceae bacterium]|nr:RagB/SusD family nutrient uptake outer membrane protein [Rikenellaceae bacterium]